MRAPRNYGDAWAKTPAHRRNGEREWWPFINRSKLKREREESEIRPGPFFRFFSLFSNRARFKSPVFRRFSNRTTLTNFPTPRSRYLVSSFRRSKLVLEEWGGEREREYVGARVYTQVSAARQKRIRIAKAANIAKFSHHPASYLFYLFASFHAY